MAINERYQWHCVADRAVFAARDGAGALVFRGRMWLLGGWNPDDKTHFPRICNSEVWSSEDGKACPDVPASPPATITMAVCFWW